MSSRSTQGPWKRPPLRCEELEERCQPSVFFSTGAPDGRMATASRPPAASNGNVEIESADDFVLTSPTKISQATFTGLLPSGAALSSVQQVVVEIYRVFPNDSNTTRTITVPTRTNSPSDDVFQSKDSMAGQLTFTASVLNPSFTAQNSVLNGIHPSPNQTTGGEGPVSGEEVQFSVHFATPFNLPADHYFFVPQVLLSSGDFFWLSAPKPITPPGTPFTPDLQSWVRNDPSLAPDWLRIGTDVVGGGTSAPTFNGAFTLSNPAESVGGFDPTSVTWYLRSSNSAGLPDAGQFAYGTAGTFPVTGDWAGTGQLGIGAFDTTTFTWFLHNAVSAGPPDAGRFQYGGVGFLPVAGDWTNSGHTGIGVFDPATQTWYLRNEPNAGAPDAGTFRYGVAGGIPVVGDWTGTGHLGIGIFDPANFTWYLRSSATAGPPDVGIFQYGGVGMRPVVGDWTGVGHAGIGVFDPTTVTFYLRSEANAGAPDAGQFAFGTANFLPVAGNFPPLVQHLFAADGQGPGGDPLSPGQLQAAVSGAVARLSAAGVDPALVQALGSADFEVGALPPGVLGVTDVGARRVTLSADAAGHGWFADGTPLQDEEFTPGGPGSPLVALPGSPAAGREDLLTAVLHEMGHLVGGPDGGTGLMGAALGLGTRDLGALDQVFAARAAAAV